METNYITKVLTGMYVFEDVVYITMTSFKGTKVDFKQPMLLGKLAQDLVYRILALGEKKATSWQAVAA